MSQLHHIFFDEARENLDLMEQSLLKFNPHADAHEQLNAIFRTAHSVKGGAAAFGFADVAEFAHLMESVLDRVRSRQVPPDASMVDLLLESVDAMRSLLGWHQGGATGAPDMPEALVRRLRASVPVPESRPAARSLEVRIGPLDQTEDLNAVIALFRDIAGLGAISEVSGQGDRIRTFAVRTDSSDEELMALFAFHVARERVSIRAVDTRETADAGRWNDAHSPVDAECSARAATAAALPAHADLATIRVASSKVDQLASLAGKLAHTQGSLERIGRALDPVTHAQLLAGMSELRRITLDLQQSVAAMRMTPMAVVFNRFPRMLRELARKLGKKFALVVQGEDIELDKAMVEKIADPLMHLVRNSCDHGIEAPAERLGAGKPEAGTITLSVALQDGSVTIDVRDDGRGLARDKLLKAARARGLEVSDQITDSALWPIVFTPGFSTVDVITDVSGRGVGMDVVKRNVVALGGTVEITSSPGQSTCVSMKLPLGRR